MTLELVPWRGATVPVLSGEIVRSTTRDYINWLTSNYRYGMVTPPAPITTYGTRPAEPISYSFEGFVQGMLYADGPVAAAEAYRLRVFGQAPLLYQELKEGRPGDFFDDEALDQLRAPWAGATLSDLMKRTLVYGDFAGNAFVLDLGDELVLVRPDWIEIVLAKRQHRSGQVGWKQVGIVYYEGGLRSNDGVPFLPGEYAHFVPGLPDPLATYRGMSWLTPLIREVQADKSASDHKVAFFENAASPNLAVSLPKEVTPTQFNEFVELMDSKHRGALNAYKTLYTGGGADVTVIGANMQQMDFSSVQGKGETRIANAAGVPPVLLSFSEGMQGSSLNAGNYTAAKRNFVDTTMRDLWQNFAGSIQQMDRFHSPRPKSRLWYDGRDIPFLHEDAKDTADIQQTRASTVSSLITAGFKPETCVTAVARDDITLLEHTGLTSVQLMPPGSTGEPGADVDGDGLPDDVPAEPIDFGALRADLGDEDEIERAFDPNQLRIGAGKHGGGRWTRMADFATALLRDWAKGEGSDDPLGEHDFSSTQLQSILRDLRKTHADDPARVKRLTPPRARAGMTERQKVDQLKTVLYKDVGAHVRGHRDSDVGPRQAKFTLQQPGKLHDKDVAVYRDADGKPALFFEDEHGNRGGLVEKFDDLEGLQKWAEDNGERRLAEWASKEASRPTARPTPPRTLSKGGPTNKTAPAGVVDLTGANGLSSDPAVREVQVENRIREAYLRARADTGTEGKSFVMLSEVRKHLGDLPRDEVDETLKRMARGRLGPQPAHIAPYEYGHLRTKADDDASIPMGGRANHMLLIEDPSLRPLPGLTPAKRAPRSVAPKPTPDAPNLDSLRQLGDPEAIRDALDLRKVDELKAMLRDQKLPVSGRKRELVDRLTDHLSGTKTLSPRKLADLAVADAIVRETPSFGTAEYYGLKPDLSPTAKRLSEVSTEAEAIALLGGDKSLTPAKLRKVADELGIDVPDDLRAKTSIQLHIAEAVARDRNLPTGFDAPDPEQAARDRQVKLDRVRSVAESLAEVDELASSQATPRALQSRIRSRAKANGLPDATRDELLGVATPDAAKVREVEVENRIRAAYTAILSRRSDSNNRWVGLADLRDELGEGTNRHEIDAALKRLAVSGNADVVPESNQKMLRPKDREAAVHFGDQDKHAISFDDPSPRDALNAELDRIATSHGLTRVTGPAGTVEPFDPERHEWLGERPEPGTPVTILRPGYDADVDGENVRAVKATVQEADRAGSVRRPDGSAAPKPTAAGVAGLPRSTGTPSVEVDAPATNPRFGTTVDGQVYRAQGGAGERWTPDLGPLPAGAYEENCTNAVAAFEMRMRGYDVEAAPLDVLDKHGYAAGRTFDEIDKLLADSWSLPGGGPHGRSFSGQAWRSFSEIDREVRAWPEGGRGYIFVGKHIFSVVKIDGKARYIEPQYDANDADSRDVTSLYRNKFGGSKQDAKLVRIDDLEPTDAILESVRARG